MQEIKLTTENSDTVHVDSVDVSKGVYAIRPDKHICYVFQYIYGKGNKRPKFYIVSSVASNDFYQEETYKNLASLMADRYDYEFFTIPDNRRIVTEKPLTVEPNSIIGIDYADGTKGWIVCVGVAYHAVSFEQKSNMPNQHIATKSTITELIDLLLKSGDNRLFLFAAYDDEWTAWLTEK